MGDILRKITELLDDGADFESIRATGIIIRSKVHWFDGLDGCADNDPDTPDGNKTKPSAEGNEEESV